MTSVVRFEEWQEPTGTTAATVDGSGNVAFSGTITQGGVLMPTASALNATNITTSLKGVYQSITSGTAAAIDYSGAGGTVLANDAGWWTSGDPTKITVDRSGLFSVSASAQIGYNGSVNFFSFALYKNGSLLTDIVVDSTYYPGQTTSIVDSASSGDYYQFYIYQQTGSSLNLWAGRNYFSVSYLRS